MKIILSQLAGVLGERRKAIAAAVAPIVVAAAVHFGWHVDVNVATTIIIAAIGALTVHTTPNINK